MWGHLLSGNSLLCSCVFLKTNLVLSKISVNSGQKCFKAVTPQVFYPNNEALGVGALLPAHPKTEMWGLSVGGAVPREGPDQDAELEAAGREVEA